MTELSLSNVLSEMGVSNRLGANRPLFLTELSKVYYVKSGHVDLFLTAWEDGQATGRRHPLCGIDSDSLIFSLGLPNLKILVLGTNDTEIVALDAAELQSLAQGEHVGDFALLVEKWLTTLTETIEAPRCPGNAIPLTGAEERECSLGEQFHCPEKLVWLKVSKGQGLLYNKTEIEKVYPDLLMPLAGKIWFTSIKTARLEMTSTADLIASAEYNKAFMRFHNHFFTGKLSEISDKKERDKRRLEERVAVDKQFVRRIFEDVAKVVGQSTKRFFNISRAKTDPLLESCRLIGDQLCVSFSSEYNVNDDDTPEQIVMSLARASAVCARKISFHDGWWRQDNGPLLGFLEEEFKPVALLSKHSSSYQMLDPTTGETETVTDGVAVKLAPYGFTFYRPLPRRKLGLLDLAKYCVKGVFWPIVLVLVISCVAGLLGLLTPYVTGLIINDVVPRADLAELRQIIIILLASALASTLFSMTRSLVMLRMTSKVDASLLAALAERLFSLPIPFYRDYLSGDLAQRCFGIAKIRTLLSSSVITTLLGAVFSVFYLAFCFYYSRWLAVIGLVAAVIYTLFYLGSAMISLIYLRPMMELQGKLAGKVLQFISAISKLRITATEDRALAIWASDFTEFRRLQRNAGYVSSLLGIVSTLYPVATTALFFYLIGNDVIKRLNVGDFMAFTASYASFQTALLHLTTPFLSLVQLVPIYLRAKPILEAEPEKDERQKGCHKLNGKIEVHGVDFRYRANQALALSKVSIKVKPGQYVAVVGTSGSGKSSLMRILLGFERPEAGSVYFDDSDLTQLDKVELRRQIGVVLQNSSLILGSIYENIVGASGLSIDEAWTAAKMAGVEGDIREMPMGMHTVLSAGGGGLSGGQRQRILIARALVRNPRVIIFDEATSALDNKTQDMVTKSLESLCVTRIAVAHRLSTIVNADFIYVLDKGAIAQQGTYDALMKDEEGMFYRLAKRQML